MTEQKKDQLIKSIDNMPDELTDELIDFAEFLKDKDSNSKSLKFLNTAKFVIQRDNNLLKKLS